MKHEILIYNKTRRRIPKKLISDIILGALEYIKLKQPVELAVLIVDKSEMKRLNKFWRSKNEAADELSFGLNSRQTANLAKRQNKVLELGEIVVNAEKVSDKKNFITILIHSLLHLLGYDHEKSGAKAKKMEQLETKILKHVSR